MTSAHPASRRRDIQGLRAFAVLVVILDHLFHWPSGGFSGVDIFFVISGFLITGLLLREWERTDHISLLDFYSRRIRRIVPAATLVLICTVMVVRLVAPIGLINSVYSDALYAFLFVSNWHFLNIDTDYFQQDRPPSPLQHYWSLSIEEQFYFVWPWLLLALLAFLALLGIKRRWDRVAAITVMAIVITGSFAYAMTQSPHNPVLSYFSSFTRIWELGVGALFACMAPIFIRIPQKVRPILAWAGLAGMVASMTIITPDSVWPAPSALLPVLAAATVIASSTGHPAKYNWLLTNTASGYIGDISYSLYLWHFPIIVLTGYAMSPSIARHIVTLVLIAVLSIAAYHAVEKPLHTSPLFQRFTARAARRRAWHCWWDAVRQPAMLGMLGMLLTMTLVLASLTPAVGHVSAMRPASFSVPTMTPDRNETNAEQAELTSEIVAALNASTFPEFDPALESLGLENLRDQWREDGCTDVINDTQAEKCWAGDRASPKAAVVVGDSYAMAWMPGLRKALLGAGYRVTQLTKGHCPAWDLSVVTDGATFTECDRQHTWVKSYLNEHRPSLVVLASAAYLADRLASKNRGSAMALEISAGLRSVITSAQDSGARVFVLGSPPGSENLQTCVTSDATPDACWGPSSMDSRLVASAEEDTAKSMGATYIDVLHWFCEYGHCPAFVGTIPVYADGSHLTVQYSNRLSPLLAESLRQ